MNGKLNRELGIVCVSARLPELEVQAQLGEGKELILAFIDSSGLQKGKKK